MLGTALDVGRWFSWKGPASPQVKRTPMLQGVVNMTFCLNAQVLSLHAHFHASP
jgi:hypothetical protein